MLLDTNAISAIGEKDGGILRILAAADTVALPFIAVAEFRYGLLGSSRPECSLLLLERLTDSAGFVSQTPKLSAITLGFRII